MARVSLLMGDYGQDAPDILEVKAFSQPRAAGSVLDSAQQSLPTLSGNAFNYKQLTVAGAGIRSLSVIGGTSAFPNSTYIDKIVVQYYPDIVVNSAAFDRTPARLLFNYSTVGSPGSFTATLYRSADAAFDRSDVALDSQTVTPTATNPQTPGLFSFSTPLLGDTSRPYLLVVADPSNTVSESNEDNNVTALLLPTVTLTLGASQSTLMDSLSFRVSVSPTQTPSASTIERRRASESTWTQLAASTSVNSTQRLSGFMVGRATATIGGVQFFSAEIPFEVQFPAYANIIGDSATSKTMLQAWTATKTFALNNRGAQDASGNYPNSRRREQGFWIRLDTSTGKYLTSPNFTGPSVGPSVGGSAVPGAKPPDVFASDGLSAVYTVGLFHTHTPTTYRTVGRAVGPSSADTSFHTTNDVVGIVYDYVATSGANIPARHPLNSAARLYANGPTRRSTPLT